MELSYDVSELNHRLMSAALLMLENKSTYSDEALIDLISVASGRPELSPYLSYPLESAIRRMTAATVSSRRCVVQFEIDDCACMN